MAVLVTQHTQLEDPMAWCHRLMVSLKMEVSPFNCSLARSQLYHCTFQQLSVHSLCTSVQVNATDALDAASMQLTYSCTIYIYLVHNNQMPAASRLEAWVALMAIVVVLEVYV